MKQGMEILRAFVIEAGRDREDGVSASQASKLAVAGNRLALVAVNRTIPSCEQNEAALISFELGLNWTKSSLASLTSLVLLKQSAFIQ